MAAAFQNALDTEATIDALNRIAQALERIAEVLEGRLPDG